MASINLIDYVRAMGRSAERIYEAKRRLRSDSPAEQIERLELEEQRLNLHICNITSLIVHSYGVPATLNAAAQAEILKLCQAELGDDQSTESDSYTVKDILSESEIECVKFAYRTAKATGISTTESITKELERVGADTKLSKYGATVTYFAHLLETQLAESSEG